MVVDQVTSLPKGAPPSGPPPGMPTVGRRAATTAVPPMRGGATARPLLGPRPSYLPPARRRHGGPAHLPSEPAPMGEAEAHCVAQLAALLGPLDAESRALAELALQGFPPSVAGPAGVEAMAACVETTLAIHAARQAAEEAAAEAAAEAAFAAVEMETKVVGDACRDDGSADDVGGAAAADPAGGMDMEEAAFGMYDDGFDDGGLGLDVVQDAAATGGMAAPAVGMASGGDEDEFGRDGTPELFRSTAHPDVDAIGGGAFGGGLGGDGFVGGGARNSSLLRRRSRLSVLSGGATFDEDAFAYDLMQEGEEMAGMMTAGEEGGDTPPFAPPGVGDSPPMALGARVDGSRRLDDDEVEVMSLRESDEDEGEGGEDGDEEKDGGGAGRASGAVAPGGARQGSSGVGKGSPLGAGRERKRSRGGPPMPSPNDASARAGSPSLSRSYGTGTHRLLQFMRKLLPTEEAEVDFVGDFLSTLKLRRTRANAVFQLCTLASDGIVAIRQPRAYGPVHVRRGGAFDPTFPAVPGVAAPIAEEPAAEAAEVGAAADDPREDQEQQQETAGATAAGRVPAAKRTRFV